LSPTYSAIWVGIGGAGGDSTLIQCGTEQDSLNGQAQYYAWYELLPNFSSNITTMAISPGHLIFASIQLANAQTNEWVLNITDTNTTQSFQNTFTYPSGQLSADWVVERPTLGTGFRSLITPLSDFGNVTFIDCTATIGSTIGDIGTFSWESFTMYTSPSRGTSAVQLTDTPELTPDGSSFTVTWLATG
jgi:hypothetical protein